MAYAQDYPNPVQVFTFTIAASATTSTSPAQLGGLRPVGLLFAEAITGGSVTFTASHDGSNYYAARAIGGSLLAVTATSIGYHGLNADYQAALAGVYDLYVARAASSGSAQTIKLIAQPL